MQDIVIVVLVLAFGMYLWYGLRQTQQDIDQAAKDNAKVDAQNDLVITKDTELRAQEAAHVAEVKTGEQARTDLADAWSHPSTGMPDPDRDIN